jgi:uncharacterized membrane protein
MAEKEKGTSRARRRRADGDEPEGRNPAGSLTDTAQDTVGGLRDSAEDGAGDVRDTAEETAGGARDTAEETAGGARDTAQGATGQLTGATQSLTAELRSTVRDAAIDVLRPVAREATTAAAKYAVKKGPDLVKGTLQSKVDDAGGPIALAQGALSKVGEAGGGLLSKIKGSGDEEDEGGGANAPQGFGRGRRLPVQEYVDVAVPVETAYNQFTQFEEFPRFMHRVEKVEQRDDKTLMWHENIWGIRRQWEAEIVEQVPDERIVWRSRGGVQTTGVVTFHRLSDRLTRVYLNVDFQPKGLLEKTASGFRLSRKALKSDLMRFKAYVEMRDDETGAWRGRIEAGEVVEQRRDGGRAEEGDEAQEEPKARAEEEPEGEGEEEPEAEADEDYDEEDEDESDEPEAEAEDEYDEDEEEEPQAAADEEEDEEEEEEEPQAAADEEEDEEEEEEEEEKPRKQARRRPATRPASRSRR